MGKVKDITGQKFGRLTALYRLHNTKGRTKSCGCLRKPHGQCRSRLYCIWENMKSRCYNKDFPRYQDWGCRGIAVCDEWYNDFMAFYDWSMNNGYKDNLTIDRIDVNGNYEPNNCRWATVKQQSTAKHIA